LTKLFVVVLSKRARKVLGTHLLVSYLHLPATLHPLSMALTHGLLMPPPCNNEVTEGLRRSNKQSTAHTGLAFRGSHLEFWGLQNHTHPHPKIWFNFPNPTRAACQTEALGTSTQDRDSLHREGQVAGCSLTLNYRLQWVPREQCSPGRGSVCHGQGLGHQLQRSKSSST
jgi:hypothetical protein